MAGYCAGATNSHAQLYCRPNCAAIPKYVVGGTGSSVFVTFRYTGIGPVGGVSCGGVGTVYNGCSQCGFKEVQNDPVNQCPVNPPIPPVYTQDPCIQIGNPCFPGNGEKRLEETDYAAASGLTFGRSYSSYRAYPGSYGPINPAFGSPSWLHTYERSLHIDGSSSSGGIKWVAQRHNGDLLYFRADGTEILNRSDTGASSTVTALPNVTGWELRLSNFDVERYDNGGRLISITDRKGAVTTISYGSNQRASMITNAFGHDLDFYYDAQNRLIRVSDPANGDIQYSYDANGRLEYVTYPDLTQKRYHYEDALPELLTGVTDESGQRFSTYDYDAQGRVILSEHAGGAGRYEFSYTGAGAPYTTTVEDPLGTSRTYSFGVVNNVYKLQNIAGPSCSHCGSSQQTSYDSNGNVLQRTDFAGNVTTYSFSSPRNLEASRTEAYGTPRARTITTQWHATYRLPAQVDEPGRRTTFTHDPAGNVLTKTVLDTASSESRTWTYTYDSFGHVLTENGPRTDVSDITTYAYYACTTGVECGQISTVTIALGQVTTYNSYNAHGQPLTITDANGVVTTLTYDARQRLTSRSIGGEATSFFYWPTGLIKRVTSPDGSYIEYSYDAAHRLTQIADNEGNRVVYTLDAMGNRTSEQAFDPFDVLARTRSRVFNALNQLAQEIGAAGGPSVTTTYGYDSNANLTSIEAPLGRDTANDYDELDRLIAITDPGSGLTQFGYNALDQLVSVTDPRSLVTSYSYNALDDLKQQTSPDTGVTLHTYDSGGNPQTRTDARGQVATYSHDALNRITSAAHSDQTIGYSYDSGTNGVGRLTGITDNSGSTTWTYTPQGRVATREQITAGVYRYVGYGYDSAGRLSTLSYPSGVVITYGYTAGKLTSITSGSETILSGVLYDPFGPIRGWTWGNASLTVRGFDLDGNLDLLDSGGLKTYAQDDAFRITGITDAEDPDQSWSYGYDLLDRLTGASRAGLSQGWTYDANGNRLSQTGTAASTYAMSGTSNRLNGVSGALSRSYGYDAAGNATADGTGIFGYDGAGRLTSASKGSTSASYSHNALGQRVRKTVNGTSTIFSYDESGHLLGEYQASGALNREYVWLGDIPVAVITGGPGTPPYVFWYIHADHLNAPRSVENPTTGELVWRWDSAPFGETAPNEDPDGDLEPFSLPLRFPGQYSDQETGLSYNYFRDYDRAIGRYVQSDPIGLGAGVNTFAYALQRPTILTDATGLNPAVWCLANPPACAAVASEVAAACRLAGALIVAAISGRSDVAQCRDSEQGQDCNDDDECERKREEDEALCQAIAKPRYGLQGMAICRKSAVQRYAECLRGGVANIRTPLHGVHTPL
jgi:RHS repeat-associated protein